jgi:hypothetical protein
MVEKSLVVCTKFPVGGDPTCVEYAKVNNHSVSGGVRQVGKKRGFSHLPAQCFYR